MDSVRWPSRVSGTVIRLASEYLECSPQNSSFRILDPALVVYAASKLVLQRRVDTFDIALRHVNNRSTDSILMGLRVACFSCTNTMYRTQIASEWENSTANTLATEYLRLDSSGRWTLPNLWPHGRSWVHRLGWWPAAICRAILIDTKARTGHATPHKSRKNAKHVTQLLVAGEISSYLVMHTKTWNWFAII